MASNKVLRGEAWEVDLEPQTHKEGPGKRNRPALVMQTDALNTSGDTASRYGARVPIWADRQRATAHWVRDWAAMAPAGEGVGRAA